MFAVFATVLCLMSVSHSAPLDCENLVRPLDQLDPHHFDGRWALVAFSLKDQIVARILKQRDSITIDLHNSTYNQADGVGGLCYYDAQNISVEGHNFDFKDGSSHVSGTVFHTSCRDCLVFRLDKKSPTYESVDLYLFSRRREVEQKEMEDFKAQTECLQMPPPIVMDPTLELCPEYATSKLAAATEEKTE